MEFSLRALSSANETTGDWPAGSGNARGTALIAGPRQQFSNPYRQRMRPMPGPPIRGQWEARLALFWIIETHRLQFRENCAHENLCVDAKDEPLGIV